MSTALLILAILAGGIYVIGLYLDVSRETLFICILNFIFIAYLALKKRRVDAARHGKGGKGDGRR